MRIIRQCRMKLLDEYKNASINETNYAALTEPYERGCKAIENRLRQMDWNYRERFGRSPFHSIEHRVKSMESILGKLERKELAPTCVNMVNRIGDIGGVRVICYYIAEVYSLAQEIKKMKNVLVLKECDYVEHPKGNGYRSYHIVVGAKIPSEEEESYLPIEIQIRTIGMDWWASMEHQLCYKPRKEQEEIELSHEMRSYSSSLYEIEKQMQKFYLPIEKEENKEKEGNEENKEKAKE